MKTFTRIVVLAVAGLGLSTPLSAEPLQQRQSVRPAPQIVRPAPQVRQATPDRIRPGEILRPAPQRPQRVRPIDPGDDDTRALRQRLRYACFTAPEPPVEVCRRVFGPDWRPN